MKRLKWILVVCLVLGLSQSLIGSGLIGCKKQVEEVAEVTPEAPELIPDEPIPPPLPPTPPPPPDEEFELKLVETIPLPEGIKDMVLDEKTGSPAIYLREEVIHFLNEKMEIEKEYKLLCPLKPNEQGCWSMVEFSKWNKFIGVNTIREYESEVVKHAEFVMLGRDGNEVWRAKHKFFRIVPSPNGEYTMGLADPSCGSCGWFIMEKEKRQFHIQGSSELFYNFSVNGTQIYIAANKYAIHKSYFGTYNNKGESLWRKDPQNDLSLSGEVFVNGLGVPHDGQYFVVAYSKYDSLESSPTGIYSFTRNGDYLWKKDVVSGGYIFRYSLDSRYLLAASEWNRVYLLEASTGKELWKFLESESSQIFRKVVTTPNFEYIVLWGLNKQKGGPNYLYLLNRNGKLLIRQNIDIQEMWISENGKEIRAVTKEGKLEIFNNPYAQ